MTQRKSATARRRERKEKEQQAKRIQTVAAIVAVIAVLVIVAVVWQALSTNEEADMAASLGAPMATEKPLAEVAPEQRNNYYSSYPEMVIDTDKDYEAVIHTSKGDIRVRLFTEQAPRTVNNFVYLANQGFYADTTFHRVIEDFMAQAGDPTGTGAGGPGYQFEDEVNNGLVFDRPGLLAMANAGPGTNGSQFFITFAPTDWLNNKHTIFGEVIAGEEVLSQITRRQPGAPTPGDTIEGIDIFES